MDIPFGLSLILPEVWSGVDARGNPVICAADAEGKVGFEEPLEPCRNPDAMMAMIQRLRRHLAEQATIMPREVGV